MRTLGGPSTPEIARAFLVPEATVAQRIVRAKRTLRDAGIAFETPRGQERRERLGAVLEVIYLIFNESYVASAGPDWLRPDLSGEAMRLGRRPVAETFERKRANLRQAGRDSAPLCPAGHLPHEGGDQMSRRLSPISNVAGLGGTPKPLISPLVGEMAGRPEGGAVERLPQLFAGRH
ncbi:hypothetical protein SAMN03159463_02769 [Mesorhizobium sp. NFR06]|uniref:DUF6596 domain-containing protein n=1 Tax=Mesorhizobium sp. NFR06 TaxID=1566290 RepID=UPI0008F2F32A|nr:DUF6596 domain-containing protein [Mesorhizobium sp. NFR06]SFO70881.1 hypothetical protein SAMN03159463_02769 [Mesorhizobium sp. NFR06]